MDRVIEQLEAAWRDIVVHLGTPEFYSQIGLALVALVSAWVLTVILKGRVRVFRDVPQPGTLHDVRLALHNAHSLLLPIIVVLLLAIATPISLSVVGEAWLVRAVQGVAVILLVYSLASRFIGST
ncbi:MAG: hypothetical protein HN420_12305, partial [Rhodospirillaceae bacterium]|nr:hypothetical protein [Rhodospirillaceae bacterium]